GRSGPRAGRLLRAGRPLAGHWARLPGMGQWGGGRFIPTLILVMMLIDLGAFVGVQGENKFGKATQDVKFKAEL
ncbi:hypothetical protein C9F08_14240, partial [Salmonella enterica subsp. enterica serovar Enteritidis]